MRYLAAVGLLAGAYFAEGSLGQVLAVSPGNVSVVWPSSGIALAAVLLWGHRLWPGMWLGAFFVNIRMLFDPTLAPSFSASLAVGATIATGSTAQALVGGRLIARLTGGGRFLERARGVFLFAVAIPAGPEGVEPAPGQGIVLDVANAPLELSLGLGRQLHLISANQVKPFGSLIRFTLCSAKNSRS